MGAALLAHRQMKLQLVLEIALQLPAAAERFHSKPELVEPLHIHAVCIMRAMAALMSVQCSASTARRLRPAAVSQ